MTLYSEASYFDGDHCAHVAAREDHQERARKDRRARETIKRLNGRDPATYGWMAPHYARQAAKDFVRIDAAMRRQCPSLKEIG